MRYFCTYFDINYLDRGIALYQSLEQHVPEFTLFVLCMDNHVHQTLSNLDLNNITLISLAKLESADPGLLNAKANRSRIEYYFTCSPALPLYILTNFPGLDLITYLDADLFFFSSPEPLLEEMGNSSVAIIGHRFPPHLKLRERYTGVYNVGWLSFRNDSNAIECLSWWRERCLEWCCDRCEDGKYADQKYLELWRKLFKGVKVLEHKGANVGPWNVANYPVTVLSDQIYIDDQKLIFFHFHGLERLFWQVYHPNFHGFGISFSSVPTVKRFVVGPYIKTLKDIFETMKSNNIMHPSMPESIRYKRTTIRSKIRRFGSIGLALFRRSFIISWQL
jgi:hypothetical protein